MVTNDTSPQHSGSRWEPTTGDAAPSNYRATGATPIIDPNASSDPGEQSRRRRRRGPLFTVLAAVLTLGASTAGVAYVHAAADPSTSSPTAPPVGHLAPEHAAPAVAAASDASKDDQQAGAPASGDHDGDRDGEESQDDGPGDHGPGDHGPGDHRPGDHGRGQQS